MLTLGVVRRTLLALGVAAGLVLVTGPAAHAHANLDTSSPGNGQRIETAPNQLTLGLTEPVELSRTVIHVVDDAGRQMPLGVLTLADRDAQRINGPVVLTVPLAQTLPSGSYHVSWRTVSTDDMHSTYGTFVFGVGTSVTATADEGHQDGSLIRLPGETVLRWATFGGLAALIGALSLMLLARRRSVDDTTVVRLLSTAWRGGVVAVAASLLLEVVLLATSPSAAWSSRFGQVWAAYVVLLVAATLLARRAERLSAQGTPVAVGALTVAVLAAAVSALVGHAAAARGFGWLTLATAAHLTSAAVWAGGVLALLLLGRAARPLLKAYALLAGPAVTVGVLSGLVLAGVLVPSVGAMTGSQYGTVLLAKIALVLGATALGGVNLALTRPRRRMTARATAGAAAGVRGTLPLETAVLLLVLAAAGALGSLGPPTSARWAPTPTTAADDEPLTTQVEDLLVTVSATPNIPGSNFVLVDVRNTRRPAPGAITGVVVTVDGRPTTAVAQGDGTWLAPTEALDHTGASQIAVQVSRSGLDDRSATQRWVVGAAPGTATGGAPLTAVTSPLVVLILLLGAVAALGAWWGRCRRRRPPPPTLDAVLAPFEEAVTV